MIELPPNLVLPEVPIEQRYKGVLNGLLTRIKGLYEAIYERYGEDGLELIREVSRKYGTDVAEKVRRGEPEWELEQVAQFLIKVFNNMQASGGVDEYSPNRVVIRVDRCPYPFTSPEICRAHTTMEQALVKGLNPELHYDIEQSIPEGGDCCLHVLNRPRPKE